MEKRIRTINQIKIEYFNWLCEFVFDPRYSRHSFTRLFKCLHKIEYTWIISADRNRALDGIDLRTKFADAFGYDWRDIRDNYLTGPCSVFEMMVGLSIRMETYLMTDATEGDRTGQWFWGMLVNMGLGNMYDGRFDSETVQERVYKMLNREYSQNGEGGLFTVSDDRCDMRGVEVWYQMQYFIVENYL